MVNNSTDVSDWLCRCVANSGCLVDSSGTVDFTLCSSSRHHCVQKFSNLFAIFDPEFLDELSQRTKKFLPSGLSVVEHNALRMKKMGG